MKLTLEHADHVRYWIRSYHTDGIVINETRHTTSLIVMPQRLIAPWSAQRFAELTVPHFEALAALDAEVILLGTGRRLHFPPPGWRALLPAAGIGLEIMDTPAACRTYNVLAAEGRRVAAALLFD